MGLSEVDPAVVETPPQPPSAADGGVDPSLADLARNTTHYVRAWGVLVAGEAALARINLGRLLLLALFIPAIAIGIVLGLDGVLAGLLYRLVSDWALALGAVVLVNAGLLVGVLVLLRRWWRTLSLPRSREALTGFWRDHDDNGTRGKNADTHRPN
ncbi:MAG TPA: hypothetical protein VFL07_14915 [Rudaea sp.]|nr:hypothetical protein [Rudaea sp.]